MFKSSRQKGSQTTPEFITSVDTSEVEVESEFAVRNVTELIFDDGQQADERSEDAVERCRWIGSGV